MAKSFEDLVSKVKEKFNLDFSNLDLSDCFDNQEEQDFFIKHFLYMKKLLNGEISSVREKDKHFINIIKNKLEPTNEAEKIYTKFVFYWSKAQKDKINLRKENKNTIDEAPPGLRQYPKRVHEKYASAKWYDWKKDSKEE